MTSPPHAGSDPRLPAALRFEEARQSISRPGGDPLRYCIFTTIAILAWILGPAPVVGAMAGLGLATYGRAWRAGARRSRCWLRDVRLVLAYLGLAFAAGLAGTVAQLIQR